MRFEIATVREKIRERCMQTAKGMHVKERFAKEVKNFRETGESEQLSTPYKQSPFTVNQKNGNSVLVEGDGVQYRRNVTM